jgi:hypothetical protein
MITLFSGAPSWMLSVALLMIACEVNPHVRPGTAPVG